ncbi:PTS glucose transporter subunit IIA [uncultured Thomasclavelia sp.]|uniref:PTS sugar transporter subunit IIA n=1 Tax=uncultured Thomasclavelia sp. TaxID=3025759 RepID=UPI00280AC7C4|nr:PTS glucose transporter subunit IIA [uncultured Thomasclavelia sp.]
MAGNLIPLSKVEDQVFSQGLMGDGFAVELKNGEIIAPFSGEVIMTFPTKHAYGLKRDDGLEVLIHIGMDTVQLNGKGFESFVNQGDFIKQGQTIAKVDLEYVLSQKNRLFLRLYLLVASILNVMSNLYN